LEIQRLKDKGIIEDGTWPTPLVSCGFPKSKEFESLTIRTDLQCSDVAIRSVGTGGQRGHSPSFPIGSEQKRDKNALFIK